MDSCVLLVCALVLLGAVRLVINMRCKHYIDFDSRCCSRCHRTLREIVDKEYPRFKWLEDNLQK